MVGWRGVEWWMMSACWGNQEVKAASISPCSYVYVLLINLLYSIKTPSAFEGGFDWWILIAFDLI